VKLYKEDCGDIQPIKERRPYLLKRNFKTLKKELKKNRRVDSSYEKLFYIELLKNGNIYWEFLGTASDGEPTSTEFKFDSWRKFKNFIECYTCTKNSCGKCRNCRKCASKSICMP